MIYRKRLEILEDLARQSERPEDPFLVDTQKIIDIVYSDLSEEQQRAAIDAFGDEPQPTTEAGRDVKARIAAVYGETANDV
jgi:hypothetical protein